MKKLFKDIKQIKLLLFSFATILIVQSTWSAVGPIGRIESVRGNAFIVHNGSVNPLVKGKHFYNHSEIITEIGAQISYTDYFDHRYILSGQGHIKVSKSMTELRKGYLWVKSLTSRETVFSIQTSNGNVDYFNKGESIISFDPYTGKTQHLVIKGRTLFSNMLIKNIVLDIHEGQFSYIDGGEKQLPPRTATPIGFSSYKKILSLFQGIQPQSENNVALGKYLSSKVKAPVKIKQFRHPASNLKRASRVKTKGESKVLIRKLKPHYRGENKNDHLLMDYYDKLHYKKRSSHSKKNTSNFVIRSFQAVKGNTRAVAQIKKRKVNKIMVNKKIQAKSNRAPASVMSRASTKKVKTIKRYTAPVNENLFEKSLQKEYRSQTRHSDEVNSLIKDLKSVGKDFYKSY